MSMKSNMAKLPENVSKIIVTSFNTERKFEDLTNDLTPVKQLEQFSVP